MKIKPSLLIFLISAVLTIASFALISVWQPFAIFAGVFLLIASGIYTYWQYDKYKTTIKVLEEMRYEDAYIYADEHNLQFNPKEFQYPKKKQREINAIKNNAKFMVFIGCMLLVIALFATIYPIFII